jgi:hypothetical protein
MRGQEYLLGTDDSDQPVGGSPGTSVNGAMGLGIPMGERHPLPVNAADEAARQWQYKTSSVGTTAIVEFNFKPQGS